VYSTPAEAKRVSGHCSQMFLLIDPYAPGVFLDNGPDTHDDAFDVSCAFLTNGKVKWDNVGPTAFVNRVSLCRPPHQDRVT